MSRITNSTTLEELEGTVDTTLIEEAQARKDNLTRIHAICRYVWRLSEVEIQTYLRLIAKRRCTIAEFMSVKDTRSHPYKHYIPLNRDAEFEVIYSNCTSSFLRSRQKWGIEAQQFLTLSYRQIEETGHKIVLVRPFELMGTEAEKTYFLLTQLLKDGMPFNPASPASTEK